MLEKHSIESLKNKAETIAIEILKFLELQGYRIPISQVKDYSEVLEAYMAIKHGSEVSINELIDLAESVLTMIPWNRELKEKLYDYLKNKREYGYGRKGLFVSEKIVSRIKFGKTNPITHLLSGKLNKEDLRTYILLRKTGILYRSHKGLIKARKYEDYQKIISKTRNVEVTADDIVKYIREIPSNYWSLLLTEDIINKIPENKLLSLLPSLQSSRVDSKVKKSILSRLSKDPGILDRLSKKEKEIIYQLIKASKYDDTTLLFSVKTGFSRRDIEKYGLKNLLDYMSSLRFSDRAKMIKRIAEKLSSEELETLYSTVSLLSFYKLSKSSNPVLRNIGALANALMYFIDYQITNDLVYLDYSSSFLRSIDPNNIPINYRPVYEALVHGQYSRLLHKLDIVELHSITEYIVERTSELYSSMYDESILENALRIGVKALKTIIDRAGKPIGVKRRCFVRRGRLDIKDSLYNIVRLNYSLVYEYRLRRPDTVAVLDISGSMKNYALWAITSLATLAYLIKYIILFSEDVGIVPLSRRKRSLLKDLLKTILVKGFSGYTDIAKALDTALKYVRGKSRIVLISDLKQTVEGDPLVSVAKIINKGHKLYVIVPRNHDRVLANKIIELGGRVAIAKSPIEVPYILRRRLNLKTGFRMGDKRHSV